MKKRTLTGLLTGLICCSLVGVGFAAWVVTGDATDEKTGGTITAEGITDESIEIKSMDWGSGPANDANISFGAPATMDIKDAWLINRDGKTEDLTAVLTVTLENPSKANVDVKAELIEENGTNKIETAKSNNLITLDPIDVKSSPENVYTITVRFKWGIAFGEKNPYTYYNANKASDIISDKLTYKADAKEKIELLKGLDGINYKLIVTAKKAVSQV